MRPIIATMILALLLGGCDLFKKPEMYSAENDAKEACSYFCESWVYATYDCIDSTDVCPEGTPPFDDMRSECKDECVDIADELDEPELDDALECMWCVVDEVGSEPDCNDVYDDEWDLYFYVSACEYECTVVESILNKFDWPQALIDSCWGGDF